jgi:hypothetical protein
MRPLPTKQGVTTRKPSRGAGKTRKAAVVLPTFNPEATYRASPTKRRRRTKEQTAQLERQMLAVWAKSKESPRHVYYVMTDTSLPEPVEKTDNGCDQVQSLSVKLRLNGRLPWDRVIDESRSGIYANTYLSPLDAIEQIDYLVSPWTHAPHHVQVWCESRSLTGVLQEVCDVFQDDLFPSGGMSSHGIAIEAAERIAERCSALGKTEVIVLYAGDYDDHGMLIGKKAEEKLHFHLHRLNPEIKLTFKRIAVTAEQVKKYKLPTKPAKKNNLPGKPIENTVEAETMSRAMLQGILQRELEALLPNFNFELEAAKKAEERGKRILDKLADLLRTGNATERTLEKLADMLRTGKVR